MLPDFFIKIKRIPFSPCSLFAGLRHKTLPDMECMSDKISIFACV